jgi:acyl-CoA reductase-like NAD-dependent aldehyde dehydrogenase
VRWPSQRSTCDEERLAEFRACRKPSKVLDNARRAFQSWRAVSIQERAVPMRNAAAYLRE